MMKQPGEIWITGHPKSVIGTTAFRGPYSRTRVNEAVRIPQAAKAWELIEGRGMTVRQAAQVLGMSVTTTWRRARWFGDWTLNSFYGLPLGPKPHQRGTRACPSGRPIVLPVDAHDVFRQLVGAGISVESIAASWRAVPACIRDIAVAHMIREQLGDDGPRC